METQGMGQISYGMPDGGQYNEMSTLAPGILAVEVWNVVDNQYKNSEGKRILELGVGAGSLMDKLRNKFGEKVFGMDIRDWFARNKKILERMLAGDLQDLPIAKDSVDIIVSMHPFTNPEDLKRALEEAERILTPFGEVTYVIHRHQTEPDKLKELLDTLKNYCGLEKLLECWKEAEGNIADSVWKKLKYNKQKKANAPAGKLEIAGAKTVKISDELGSAWVVTLKKMR